MTSKILNNVVELNKINYDSTNNRIDFSTAVYSNGSPIADETAGRYANAAFIKANAAFDAANSAVHRESFLANNSQTVFQTNGYNVGYVDVFVNGIKLYDATDFTATDGLNVTILDPVLESNDVVEIVNWGGSADPISRVDVYARDLSNVAWTTSNTAIVNANLSYIHANAAFNIANTLISTSIDLYSRAHANAAFLQANSVYNAVNTLSQSAISNGSSNVSVIGTNGNVRINIAGVTTETISANLVSKPEGVLDDVMFRVNAKNVTSNISISADYNHMSIGPITINNGITVNIQSGAVWTIV